MGDKRESGETGKEPFVVMQAREERVAQVIEKQRNRWIRGILQREN